MVGPEALSPWEAIRSLGDSIFMLCEKPEEEKKKTRKNNRKSNFSINRGTK
ncbi:hypothetical protein DY000_02032375 [Brassica cretica]|uniref:Uncharacterized protein n=1 Tax=Brassica cretica TaxID=69181 RepID=A0ABQ7DJR8_BRACR|nr:hypothetical protein DY000_02032375 [Brassica cretica]